MKYYYLSLLILLSTAAQAQKNPALAKTIDSLYQEDQAVQLKLKAMSERQAPKDSLKLQDSLKKQTYVRGLQAAKSIYEKYGYPTRQLVGADATHHFFVLIQHADSDPQFQVAMLPVLDKQSKKGNVDRKDYAYLYDRVQRNTGGKQLYGTQLSYDKTGNLFDSNNRIIFPADLADPQHVDERRKEIGLEPLEQYYEAVLQMLGRPKKKL